MVIPKSVLAPILSASVLFTACRSNDGSSAVPPKTAIMVEASEARELPYTIAQHYFVKNTEEANTLYASKIGTREEFDARFGMAATMGAQGRPTAIDFTTQYVIAVAVPQTDTATELRPVSLLKSTTGQVIFTYISVKKEKLSFSIRPLLLLIADRKDEGDVFIREQIQ